MSKQLLSPEWVSRLSEFGTILVGFSGGLDSTVLLHLLASHTSLRTKIRAVHINHGLSPNAPLWEKHCGQVCLAMDVAFLAQKVEFARTSNIEEGARIARYAAFNSLIKEQDCLVLAHHQDDQAETLLLQLFRGAGVDGLAAMTEVSGSILRPLLSHSRQQLEHYAQLHELAWIEDESNQDIYYSRNYLRQQVMPLLTKQWSGVVGNIARAANHCQQAKVNLDGLALLDCPALISSNTSLCIEPIRELDFERLSNVLRVWLKKNQVQLPSTQTFKRIIHEVLLASSDAMPIVSWGGIQVRRYQNYLYLDSTLLRELPACIDWSDFPKPLVIDKLQSLSVIRTDKGLKIPPAAKIQVRFRQGGERFTWHGQTKQLKKLTQEWAIPPWLRERIPLIYINDELAMVVGYGISDRFYIENEPGALLIV